MGKSQSRLGFKSWFEPIWQLNLRCKDSIWNTAIRFAIWFENLAIRFENLLNRGKSQVQSLTMAIIRARSKTGSGAPHIGGDSDGGQYYQRLEWRSNLGYRLAACSIYINSQPRRSAPYSQQTVGPWSTFYTHTITCITDLPGQSLVTLWSVVHSAVCCNMISGAQTYTCKLQSLHGVVGGWPPLSLGGEVVRFRLAGEVRWQCHRRI